MLRGVLDFQIREFLSNGAASTLLLCACARDGFDREKDSRAEAQRTRRKANEY
jgi:hypothetical protein